MVPFLLTWNGWLQTRKVWLYKGIKGALVASQKCWKWYKKVWFPEGGYMEILQMCFPTHRWYKSGRCMHCSAFSLIKQKKKKSVSTIYDKIQRQRGESKYFLSFIWSPLSTEWLPSHLLSRQTFTQEFHPPFNPNVCVSHSQPARLSSGKKKNRPQMWSLSFKLTSAGRGQADVTHVGVEKVFFSAWRQAAPSSSWFWRCWRCGARPRGCPPCGAWRPSLWWPGAGCPSPAAGGLTPGTASGSGTGGARRRGWCRSPPRTAASGASHRWSPGPASRTGTAARWTAPEEDTEGVSHPGTCFFSGNWDRLWVSTGLLSQRCLFFLLQAGFSPDLRQPDRTKVWLYKISRNMTPSLQRMIITSTAWLTFLQNKGCFL